jgi:hypothetical protein
VRAIWSSFQSSQFEAYPLSINLGRSEHACGRAAAKDEEVLFPIVHDDYYGYIDRTGAITIKPQFSRARRFRDGLAPVQREVNQPLGYIATKGEFVVEPRFGRATEFSEGLAGVSLGPEGAPTSFDVIDTTGRVVFQQTIYDMEGFSKGLKLARGENKKWGSTARFSTSTRPPSVSEPFPMELVISGTALLQRATTPDAGMWTRRASL